jgi:hypothetical protein
MEDTVLYTHIGAINAGDLTVKAMQSQVELGYLKFCSAPNVRSAPDIITLTEVPSFKQAHVLAQFARDTLKADYAYGVKKVQTRDHTVLLYNTDIASLTPRINRPLLLLRFSEWRERAMLLNGFTYVLEYTRKGVRILARLRRLCAALKHTAIATDPNTFTFLETSTPSHCRSKLVSHKMNTI